MNVLITGVSQGIGKEIFKTFVHKNNGKVIGLARNKEALNELKQELNAQGYKDNFELHNIDITKDRDLQYLEESISNLSSLDYLINNAGLLIKKEIENLSLEDVRAIYEVNVFAVFAIIKSLKKYLKNSENGAHIVNISSIGGIERTMKFPGMSGYSSSKGALSILTECLAEEFKDDNIKVNCLALGGVDTEMLQKAAPGIEIDTKPYQISEIIVDFCLKGKQFYNGKIIPVSDSTP